MNGIIKKAKDTFSSAKSILASVGPLLISQAEKSSEAYARHQLKMANVEAAKTLVVEEAKSIASVRDSLRKKFVGADPEERIRLRRDLMDSEAEIRQLHIAAGAMAYLPEFSGESTEAKPEEAPEPISDHWMDRFNQFARQNNESWRQDLLSRALAMQAANPDSVSPRAVWTIGTLEKSKFDAFSAILDISCQTKDSSYIIPGEIIEEKIPQCDLGTNVVVGTLVFSLSDTGLMANGNSCYTIDAGETLHIGYRKTGYVIRAKNQWEASGLMPTETGQSIARFYNTRENEFGRELLTKWTATLKGNNYHVTGPVKVDWG